MTVVPPTPDPAAPPAPATPPAPTTPVSAPIAPPGPAPTAPPAPPAAPATPAPAAPDPDAGAKTALEAERTARKAADKAAADLRAELDQLKKGPLSDADKAIADAKAEGANEVTVAMNARLLAAELKAAAAGKLADPDDARLIDTSEFKAGDDGNFDQKAIVAAIDKLVADKPHLAAGFTPKPGPVGGGPQGVTPAITRDQLKTMTPQQIAELDPKLVDAALAAP